MKGKPQEKAESLLIASKNSAKRTNYIKVEIDNNSKCWLCRERIETINHINSECSQVAQKESKVRHDWWGKVIDWELYKRLKFDHLTKWYIHKTKSIRENELDIPMDFKIQTDHLTLAR